MRDNQAANNQTSAGSISMSIAFQIMIDRVAVIERQLRNVERGY